MNADSSFFASCERCRKLVLNTFLCASLSSILISCVGSAKFGSHRISRVPSVNLLFGEVVKMRFVEKDSEKAICRGRSRNGSQFTVVLESVIEPVKSSYTYGTSFGYSAAQRALSRFEFAINGVSHSVPADQIRLFKNPHINGLPAKLYLYPGPGSMWALVAFSGGDGGRSYNAGFIFGPSGYVTTIPDKIENDRLEALMNRSRL
jgi:hypothetical protein